MSAYTSFPGQPIAKIIAHYRLMSRSALRAGRMSTARFWNDMARREIAFYRMGANQERLAA